MSDSRTSILTELEKRVVLAGIVDHTQCQPRSSL